MTSLASLLARATAGDVYPPESPDSTSYTAGIDVPDWGHRIEVYGHTPEQAAALRDLVLEAIRRAPPSGEPTPMPYTDEYSRVWQFKPSHDTASALQVPRNAAEQAYRVSQFATGTQHPQAPDYWPYPADVYLLKMSDGWHLGLRYGDEPESYISAGLDNLAILALLKHHRRTCDPQEHRVVVHLLGDKP